MFLEEKKKKLPLALFWLHIFDFTEHQRVNGEQNTKSTATS